MGIRESRRIMGDYVLTKEDVVEGRRFDDAVSMGGYHVDIHNPSGTWAHSADVEAYTIPFRSPVARGVDGLLIDFTGRGTGSIPRRTRRRVDRTHRRAAQNNHVVLLEQDQVVGLETAWVR
jgi:hypothetical protein